jgi:hypothetical protein
MMRILVATDGSEPSKEAIRQVTSRPWPEDSEIKVVLVELPVDKGLIAAGFQTAFDQMVLNQRSEAFLSRLRIHSSRSGQAGNRR